MQSSHWQHTNNDVQCPEWHQDCLAVVLTLAGCFSIKELKKFCRLTDWKIPPGETDGVRCLETLHKACHCSPEVIKAVEKNLSDRFRTAISKVRRSETDRIEAMWDETEWPFPVLWACLVDERDDVRLKAREFLHDLAWSAVTAWKRKDSSEAQAGRIKSMSSTIGNLQAEVRTLRRELKQKPKVIKEPAVEAPSIEGSNNPKKLAEMKREVKRLRHLITAREETIEKLEKKLAISRKLLLPNDNLLNMRTLPVTGEYPCEIQPEASNLAEGSGGACNRIDLCRDCPLEGRRILIIGGLERMETTYREVVHQMGGSLCYHGGHVKSNSKKLKKAVVRADGAIFITSVNSHAAQSVVKDTCKKVGTPLLILRETGANSLEKALRGMAA